MTDKKALIEFDAVAIEDIRKGDMVVLRINSRMNPWGPREVGATVSLKRVEEENEEEQ